MYRVMAKRAGDRPHSLGEAILAEMTARGWTQYELARRLETREKNVRNWIKGSHAPSHPMYVRLCLLFGWPLPYSDDSTTGRYPGLPGHPMPDETRDVAFA